MSDLRLPLPPTISSVPEINRDAQAWGATLVDALEKLGKTSLPFINVKDNGLRGDGSTSDTAAWDTLVSRLPSTGAEVFFPAGKYVGSFTATGKDNLRVFGAGGSSTLHNETANLDALKFVDCDDLEVSGLHVQGASGTRDGLHLENCQRARARVSSGGSGRAMVWAQKCIGIVVEANGLSVGSGPYPAGVGNPQAGLVLTWDGSDATSGCNQFVIEGGEYIVGQTPQSSTNTSTFAPGWAICLIRAEGGIVNGPITELSAGGIYAQYCENIDFVGYYGELNPSDIEYSTGTISVTAATTAVVGVGTTWNNTPTSPEQKNGFPGKYLVAPIAAGMKYAKVATLTDNTHLTLAAQTELLETGWPGGTLAGSTYRLVEFDLFLDNCKGGSVGPGCRGGGAIALKGSHMVTIDNALCDSLLIDGGSLFNDVEIRTNRGNAGSTGRFVDLGIRTIIRRQVNHPSVAMGIENSLPIYTAAARPDQTLRAGQLIYVSDAAAGSKLQYSDGTNWIAAG